MNVNLQYQVPIIEFDCQLESQYDNKVDQTDSRYNEPLVKLADYDIAFESYHAKDDGNNPPYHQALPGSSKDGWLRLSMAIKLQQANQALAPFGVELLVLDAYRTLECQKSLWDFYYEQLKQQYPDANVQVWQRYTGMYVRNPAHFDRADDSSVTAHLTGASIDATLRDIKHKQLLDMGCRFENICQQSQTDFYERQWVKGLIADNDPRLVNRRLLHWALSEQGLINDPKVFWHHDWGNLPWSKLNSQINNNHMLRAWYGISEPPSPSALRHTH